MSSEANQSGEPGEWIAVAVLGRVRGVRGELTAIDLSGRPGRLESLSEVWLFGDGSRYEVESLWFHDGRPIFKFRGIDSIDEAAPLVGAEVRVPKSQRAPLEPGEFFQADLIGCEVVERSTGMPLGRVVKFHDQGEASLLELADGMLIPFARSICVEIEPESRRIAVDLPEGLKDLNRP
ncbi:MAG TPA: ribosome maturation factor RimM [Bryobacteraceae bacterium]|nr:ribosome maturation factor RimM [Bryobacteraceae bacterium]